MKHGIGVKAFIVNSKGELLLIKRAKDDSYKPGVWELPGGKLDIGEDPLEGLKRETKEETGIDIEVLNPMKVHNFIIKRNNGDSHKITMTTFLCRYKSGSVVLSKEHTEHRWIPVDKSASAIIPFFKGEIELFLKHFNNNL